MPNAALLTRIFDHPVRLRSARGAMVSSSEPYSGASRNPSFETKVELVVDRCSRKKVLVIKIAH